MRKVFSLLEKKERFYVESNVYSLEDLFDLPYETLAAMVRELKKELEDVELDDVFSDIIDNKDNEKNKIIKNKINIIKDIVKYRKEKEIEKVKALEEAQNKEREKEIIQKIILEKEMERYKEMDLDELKKRLNK